MFKNLLSSPSSKLIPICCGIGFFILGLGLLLWKIGEQKQFKRHQQQLHSMREETERQLEELDDLARLVRETTEHSQIWWRTMDYLSDAREQEKRWSANRTFDSGSVEQEILEEWKRRIELLSEYMKY